MSTRSERRRRAAGSMLAALRERRGLSQRELATTAGVHFTTVWRVEHGTHASEIETVGRLLDAMGAGPRFSGEVLRRLAGIAA